MTDLLTICRVDASGIYLSHRIQSVFDSIPEGWIVTNPPEDLSVINIWLGTWQTLGERPEPSFSPEPYKAIQISRIDFARLFSGMQQASINAFRKACAALTPADYADPSAGLLIQLEIVFQQFDLPAEFIELNHPDTRLGMELLGYAGVFGKDPATISSEIDRVIAGDPPA